jgi:hypothetical protein
MSVIAFASVLIFGFGFAYSHWPNLIAITQIADPAGFTPYYFLS